MLLKVNLQAAIWMTVIKEFLMIFTCFDNTIQLTFQYTKCMIRVLLRIGKSLSVPVHMHARI